MDAKRKIIKALGSVMRTDPFFGPPLLKMNRLAVADGTISVDGVTLRYNPAFVAEKSDTELAVILAHEAMHITHGHHLRSNGRSHEQWNEACDYAINSLLRGRNGMPKDVLLPADKQWPENQTAEWYFKKANEEKKQEEQNEEGDDGGNEDPNGEDAKDSQSDGNDDSGMGGSPEQDDEQGDGGDEDSSDDGDDGDGSEDAGTGTGETGDEADEEGSGDNDDNGGEGSGQHSGNPKGVPSQQAPGTSLGDVMPCPLEPHEAEAAYVNMLCDAAEAAKDAGNLPGWAKQLVENALQPPRLPWKQVLRQFVTKSAKDKLSYQRPPRRSAWRTDVLMPSRMNRTLGKVALAVDTSGSMDINSLNAILAELKELLRQFPESEVVVIQFDTQVHKVELFGQGKALDVKSWEWRGRGGTYYDAAMQQADNMHCDCLMVATDGYPNGDTWPDPRSVRTPVLWLMTTMVKAPWGRTVKVEV